MCDHTYIIMIVVLFWCCFLSSRCAPMLFVATLNRRFPSSLINIYSDTNDNIVKRTKKSARKEISLCCFKKNLNGSRPSEYPPVRGKHFKTFLVGSQAAKTDSLWDIVYTGSPMVVTLGQQYNVGKKPTVILDTHHINRHAGIPDKTE